MVLDFAEIRKRIDIAIGEKDTYARDQEENKCSHLFDYQYYIMESQGKSLRKTYNLMFF